jgi:hypothetical protein
MRARSLILAAAVALAASFAPAAEALAAEPADEAPVCASWKAEGATGAYPAVTFGGKPDGTVITKNSAKLMKPATGVQPGVQFAAKDVDLKAPEGGTTVAVTYKLTDGAKSDAGAVRLFGYDSPGASTLTDAPSWQDTATGDSGQLVLNVPAGKTIAILGLVYDASNDSAGAVTFTDMTIGKRAVSFTTCPKPEPSETATASPSPTGSASPTATSEPTTSSSPSPAGTVPAGNGPSLPVTGPSMGALIGFGVFVVALGAVAVIASRRQRRQSFEA